ncbi:MAG: signal peptidase II [Bacillota bacterium]|nr:signal peptidase II [Bacillota bacterium]
MEIIIIILGILIDRLTKLWALNSLTKVDQIAIINNFFDLQYLENRGAAWGTFQNKTVFLAAVTLLIIAGMIFYFVKFKPKGKLFRAALALILAGALGNLYDRLIYKYVVDFIHFHYKDVYNFPTFNVADMCVVIGTAFLIIHVARDGK